METSRFHWLQVQWETMTQNTHSGGKPHVHTQAPWPMACTNTPTGTGMSTCVHAYKHMHGFHIHTLFKIKQQADRDECVGQVTCQKRQNLRKPVFFARHQTAFWGFQFCVGCIFMVLHSFGTSSQSSLARTAWIIKNQRCLSSAAHSTP